MSRRNRATMPLEQATAVYALLGCRVASYYVVAETHTVTHPRLPGYSFAFLVKQQSTGTLVVYRHRHQAIVSAITQALAATTTPSNHDNT